MTTETNDSRHPFKQDGDLRLQSVTFPESLDTSEDDIVARLYVPALRASSRYDRGVGYFTSGWLSYVAEGLAALAANGGKMRLITSPHLSPEDWGAVKQGEDAKNDPRILATLNEVLDDLESAAKSMPLTVLAWLIADGLLDLRIAIPTAKLTGDFHIKIGVFQDAEGDFIAFNGSPNETVGGFQNFEKLHIHLGWTNDRDAVHAKSIANTFDRLWNKHDPNVRCFELPTAIQKRLVRFAGKTNRPYPLRGHKKIGITNKWRHQDEALAEFLKARAGVLGMATGTGKTRTALKIDTELRERDLISSTIVAAYGTDLLDQWYSALVGHDYVDLIYRQYDSHNDADKFRLSKRPACLIVNRRKLAEVIRRLSPERIAQTLIICDEVHGFGEPGLVSELDGQIKKFPYRLGLSATPSREYDDDGNDFIKREIGPVIFRFDIQEAIRRGILCEFDYHPIEFQFSPKDRAAVQTAFAKQRSREEDGDTDRKQLWMELAKIKKLSTEKIPLFEDYVARNPAILQRTILFVEQADYGALLQPILMRERVKFHTYYGDDDRENLRRFARGDLSCLIACKRISEGIDIQSVHNIVLFATAKAPIETVQRVGRCLRIDPKNPNKRATIVDFIKTDEDDELPPPDAPLSTDERRRAWFQKLAAIRRERAAMP
ncbi:DEAD/DEAH box helicase family protein [Rhizobium sp. L1K21]|uniref:DEAD/DEAH box helicase family protein n=1 Tax=Rhizobium sp. L1K21 TaxID=2954933 RepID=UPI002093A6AC|nr:DEAD/DEAH box helicase family protein [Rhizobium sp. L1K21]MCO6185216.1 DEAD/DEAH box helicase family protein [Rhizobium sp. L1K21]